MPVSATYPLLPTVGSQASPGGQVPEPPFATDAFRVSIRRAPTKTEILDILKKVTAPGYHAPITDDPRGSIAIYRQMACQMAVVADKGLRSQQSVFHLPYPTQADEPASSAIAATSDVTLSRSELQDRALVAEIGSIVLSGPHGRQYFNSEQVVWSPFDESDQKTVEFTSNSPGFVGNLDHLSDANGLIANPDGTPALEYVDFESQGGTSNSGASIVANPGSLSSIIDSGAPDTFSESDVGLYVEITASAHAENVGRVLRVTSYSETAGSPIRTILVDDGSVRQQIFSAQADDGGSFTDETSEARSSAADDMTLLPAAPAVNDAYYFGANSPFDSIELTISTPGVGTWAVAWEYWDGNNYVPPTSLIDNSAAFTASGTVTISWNLPSDWITDTVNGVTAYWFRARVTSFTSITTQPLGQIAYLFVADSLTPESGTASWAVRNWDELGVTITQIVAPSGGRDGTLRMLGDERGVTQQSDETDDDFRQRVARLIDVVTPNAIQNSVNRTLYPYGFEGLAIDVQNGFDGWFFDIDAWDYYETDPVQFAISDDGGSGTDETAEAQSAAADDMTLLPATVATLDAYFFGQSVPFSSLEIDITTPGIGDWVIEWRYWNGSTNVALSGVADNSDAFKNPGVRKVSWDVPGDWATESPFGVGSAYYVHARVTSVTTTTQQPLGRRANTAFEFPAASDRKVFLSGGNDSSGDGEGEGWFFVVIPCLPSELDFGFSWDLNEPANTINGELLASAWDVMVFDGEPTDANATHKAIYDQVDKIRASGVGFTLIRDCELNEPICP